MMDLRETVSVAIDALRANKVRAMLTSLGVIIGSASIVLVVTVALTSQKFVMFMAKSSHGDLRILSELMEAGKVTPVIDKRYRLSEVPEAIRYVEQGHARGKVVITLE